MKKNRLCSCICAFVLLGFLLGVHDGRIALWKDGSEQPWRIFPYPYAVLPADTKRELEKRIRIDTMEDLDRLLENLLS